MQIKVWTDGSARVHKEGLGGSGCYIKYGDKEHYLKKGWRRTKTGRAEIHAILMVLRAITDKSAKVVIYSDSQYCVKTIMQGWIDTWRLENYYGKANKDLWEQVYDEISIFKQNRGQIKLFHVKGHIGVEENEIADILADYKQFKDNERYDDISIEDWEEYQDELIEKKFQKEKDKRIKDLKGDLENEN